MGLGTGWLDRLGKRETEDVVCEIVAVELYVEVYMLLETLMEG